MNFVNKNYQDIKKGGFQSFIRKLRSVLTLLLCFINPFYYLALIFFLFCSLIKPFLIVRWGILPSERIGHFSVNTEIYCCKIDSKINVPEKNFIDLFCFGKEICNYQLAKMWKRKLNILPRFILFPVININKLVMKVFNSANHFIHLNEDIYSINEIEKLKKISTHRDLFNLMPFSKPHLSFTQEEIQDGDNYLKYIGIDKNSKIVCLIVRDSAYQEKYLNSKDLNLNHNNFRNQDISNYLLASEELTKRGYWVFRMGKAVNKKIENANPKIIDYANSKFRSDFLDIFLGYRCSFCIRTAGFGGVPEIFRKPLVVNEGPIVDLCGDENKNLYLLQYYFSKEKNRYLTLSEIFELGVSDIRTSQEYENLKIKVIKNSPEEIKDVVIEMVDRIEGAWSEKPEIEKLQKSFFKIFEKNLISHKKRQLFGGIKLRQSSSFLNKNRWWLE